MKNKLFALCMTAGFLVANQVKAQTYFAAETTTEGVFTYVKMPEGTKALAGATLKGKATAITAAQYNAIVAGETVKAIVINGKPHVPNAGIIKQDGGYKWCSYELPNGGTGYYRCKIPKNGADCCKMVIDLTPATPSTTPTKE